MASAMLLAAAAMEISQSAVGGNVLGVIEPIFSRQIGKFPMSDMRPPGGCKGRNYELCCILLFFF